MPIFCSLGVRTSICATQMEKLSDLIMCLLPNFFQLDKLILFQPHIHPCTSRRTESCFFRLNSGTRVTENWMRILPLKPGRCFYFTQISNGHTFTGTYTFAIFISCFLRCLLPEPNYFWLLKENILILVIHFCKHTIQ